MIPSLLSISLMWLHTIDGLHLSGDLNEWLSVIESLEDSSGESLWMFLMAAVLATAASASPLASLERAEE